MPDTRIQNIEEGPEQTEIQASIHNQSQTMNRGVRRSERLGRYRNYNPPPAGFDPYTAPDEVLLRHGLPRRPDPERDPDLARIWKRIFARPLTYLKAELEVDKVMSDRKPVLPKDPDFGAPGWAGAIVRYGGPFKWVFAEWVIPEVKGDKHFWEDDITVAFWVGIDGFVNNGDGQFQVLQAGISANLFTSWRWGWPHTEIGWYVWTEWWNQNDHKAAVAIPNFYVYPGQKVSFLVCAPQPGDAASVFIANTSTCFATSVRIDAPEGITSQGDSAEWIVEQPRSARILLQFGPISFYDCQAGNPDPIVDFRNAFVNNISAGSRNLTDAEIERPNSVVVNWISSD
jgi:hypothetical protein